MSRFYASIQGDTNGEATRRGFRSITGHVRGWNTGVGVDAIHTEAPDTETYRVSITGGSNGGSRTIQLATITRNSDGSLTVELGDDFSGRDTIHYDAMGRVI